LGFVHDVQQLVTAEVEAAFEPLCAASGEARQVVRSLEPRGQGSGHRDRIDPADESRQGRQLQASGISQPDATRLSADSLKATDVAIG
jgi:hypothetical protein